MLIHADLTERVVVNTEELPWVDSPAPGVQRRMLERDGDEVARATSVVRYAPGSRFGPHVHEGGEEFFVLEGVFSDEQGDYPAGTYVRNPPGSRHSSSSREGCTIFVKLRQMDAGDTRQVRIDTHSGTWSPGRVPRFYRQPLYVRGAVEVALVRLEAGVQLPSHAHPGGEELLVLEGILDDEYGRYPTGTWLRNPPGSRHEPRSGDGCLVFIKHGHLAGR